MKLFQHRLFRQASQMLGWQFLTRGCGFISAIWAARCLGPEKLGISGMVVSTVWQLALLVNLNQDNALIRSYKNCESDRDREWLVSSVVSFRLLTALGFLGVAFIVLPWLRLNERWWLAASAGIPFLLLATNGSGWILQAQENAPIYHRSVAVQAGLTLLLYVSLMRPGAGAGLDVIITTCAFFCASLYAWRYALRGFRLNLNLSGFLTAARRVFAEKSMIVIGFAVFIYTNSGLPLVGYLAGIEQAGQFRSASNLAYVFAQAIQIMMILLYPRFIEWHQKNPKTLHTRQNKIALTLAAVLVPFIAGVFVIASPVFRLVYGPAFGAAAYPWAMLMASKAILAVSGIYSAGLWARKEDSGIASAMVLVAAISLVSNLVAIRLLGMLGAALVAVLSESLVLIVAILLTRKLGTAVNSNLNRELEPVN